MFLLKKWRGLQLKVTDKHLEQNWYISALTEVFWLKSAEKYQLCSTCLFVPFIWRSLHFLAKSFPFLFLFLCSLYFGTFPFHVVIQRVRSSDTEKHLHHLFRYEWLYSDIFSFLCSKFGHQMNKNNIFQY